MPPIMAMIQYNEVKEGKYIVFEGAPHEVLTSHVFRKQQRKPVNATKLKNLITGKVVEYSFHVSEKAELADLSEKNIRFLYSHRGEHWFSEEHNPKERFQVDESFIASALPFMKANSLAKALLFDEKIIGVRLPIKVELKVVEAPPGTKGNTAQGGSKQVKLETGAVINVPLFVNEGDTLRINTETGEYTERV